MTYATAGDMDTRFGAAEVAKLGDADRIAEALGDAAAEIDAALAPRYALPLAAGPWPLLRALECDLARYRLYDNSAPDPVSDRAAKARTILAAIGKGDLALLDAAGKAPARTTAARHDGPDPVMTADNLEGFTL